MLSIGLVGTIGGHVRRMVQEHPRAEIVGLRDVDRTSLDEAAAERPGAFTCRHDREGFDRHGDRFDAVIVATPDHSHCPIMTRALADGKHVHGQKPLVQQLEKLEILQRAIDARPELVTRVGAQRTESRERRAACHPLKAGVLGPIVEVHVASGNGALAGGHHLADGRLGEPCDPPPGLDDGRRLCGAAEAPCRPDVVPRRWRSWWEHGGGQIAAGIVHLTDVVVHAFPELTSPTPVCTRTPSRDLRHVHADRVSSTPTDRVSTVAFTGSTCNLHVQDTGLQPDRRQLGIGGGDRPGGNDADRAGRRTPDRPAPRAGGSTASRTPPHERFRRQLSRQTSRTARSVPGRASLGAGPGRGRTAWRSDRRGPSTSPARPPSPAP